MWKWTRVLRTLLYLSLLLPLPSGAGGLSVSDSEAAIVAATIRISPENIVLGRETEVEIRVLLPDTFERRAECKNIQLRVSTGEVIQVIRIASGVFAAKYNLPEEFYPQFALVTATGFCGGRTIVGSTAHPLFGSGKVTVQSKPYSKVTLQIDKDTFGPSVTDEFGRAEIPVVVRPGIFTGIAGEKVIDLDLPDVKRVVAYAVPPRVSADSEDGAILWIHAIDKVGRPLSAPSFSVTAADGSVSAVEFVAPGIFRARYKPPTQVGDGVDRVTVSMPSDSASEEIIEMAVLAGRPAQISSAVTPDRYVASSSDSVTVFARVFDKKGNPTDAELTAITDLGELAPLPSAVSGEYRWALSLPSFFQDKKKARIRIFDKANPQLESVVFVDLVSEVPASIQLEKPESPIPADGYTPYPLYVLVLDRYENPVLGLRLEMVVSDGVLTPPIADAAGKYLVEYTPPLGVPRKEVRLKAESGSVTAETTLLVTDRIYRFALALELGYFSNIGLIHAPVFSIVPDFSLWRIARGLHAGIDLGYYFSNADSASEGVTSVVHVVPILGQVGYQFWFSPRWMLDLDVGIGPVAVRHILEMTGVYEEKESSVQFGVEGAVGIGLRIGPGQVTFKVRYLYVTPPNMTSLAGSLGGISLMFGYRFSLE